MEDKVEKLLDLTVGELREKLAYEDCDTDVRDFINDLFEDCDDCDGWDDDEDYDYDDEDEEDSDVELPYEQEELARNVAADISDGKYNINVVEGLYDNSVIERIRQLID